MALADYVEREVRGWTVHVHPDVVADGSTLGAAVLELLDHELFEAARALPAPAVARLRRVPLWISLDETDWPGGVYHPSAEWLVANGHDPALAGCIQFGVAANLLTWERDQPSMLIHELAHAWHHQVVGYGDERLLEAYAAALESGSYESVLRGNGRRERAYALTNPQEYFAELSAARFGTNDFHPFVRAELGLHDPGGVGGGRRPLAHEFRRLMVSGTGASETGASETGVAPRRRPRTCAISTHGAGDPDRVLRVGNVPE